MRSGSIVLKPLFLRRWVPLAECNVKGCLKGLSKLCEGLTVRERGLENAASSWHRSGGAWKKGYTIPYHGPVVVITCIGGICARCRTGWIGWRLCGYEPPYEASERKRRTTTMPLLSMFQVSINARTSHSVSARDIDKKQIFCIYL